MREYVEAYEAWEEVNIKEPWRRTRALSFYVAVTQGAKFKSWEDVFPIGGEKIRKKQKASFRRPTEEEVELLKKLRGKG